MSDESPTLRDMEHYLAHHGVKGQKWGVRKAHLVLSGKLKQTGSVRMSTLPKKTTVKAAASVSSTLMKKVGKTVLVLTKKGWEQVDLVSLSIFL